MGVCIKNTRKNNSFSTKKSWLLNGTFWKKTNCPIFTGCHDPFLYESRSVKIFLRRNFPDVLRSCQKAATECGDPLFQGGNQAILKRWEQTTAFGCLNADLVIDYKTIQVDPAAAVRAAFHLMNCPVSEREIARAVLAGRRENMRREQQQIKSTGMEIVNRENCYGNG